MACKLLSLKKFDLNSDLHIYVHICNEKCKITLQFIHFHCKLMKANTQQTCAIIRKDCGKKRIAIQNTNTTYMKAYK